MARITPPMEVEGLFILRSPFKATPTVAYRVKAHRSFEDLIDQGEDPMELVYKPAGLDETKYAEDKAAGAFVVSLFSKTEKVIHVPDTYIESYPDMGIVPHSWMTCCASLGMLPDTYDTTALAQAVSDAISEHVGVPAEMFIARAPVTSAVTQTQYVQNLNARQAAIRNRDSTYAENLKLTKDLETERANNATLLELVEQLQARIAELEGTPP